MVTYENGSGKHALSKLSYGFEPRVYGDKTYHNLIESAALQAETPTKKRLRKSGSDMDEAKRASNCDKSTVRAELEQVRGVVKRLWGFTKVRYSSSNKNASHGFVALALADLYLAQKPLLEEVRPTRVENWQKAWKITRNGKPAYVELVIFRHYECFANSI